VADNHYSKTLPLRGTTGPNDIEMITSAGNWPLVEDNSGMDTESYMSFRTWGVASGLWLSHLTDLATQAGVLIAFGHDREQVEDLSQRIVPILQPLSREEMLSRAHGGGSAQDRARAIVRVALAAGDDFDHEIFQVILDAARDVNRDIRNAAAWSTTYLTWPQSLSMLEDMASGDQDEQVRIAARELLDSFRGDA
jgi:hypothetical protein